MPFVVLLFALVVVFLCVGITDNSSAEPQHIFGTNIEEDWDEGTGELLLSGSGPIKDYQNAGADVSAYYPGLTTLIIGNGITHVGNYVFKDCKSLQTVTFGSDVNDVGEGSFFGCSALVSVVRSGASSSLTVQAIGGNAFRDCTQLTAINLGTDVVTIGDGAFRNCSEMTSIGLPESLTSIGTQAFMDCKKLDSVTIPSGVHALPKDAFRFCDDLLSVTFAGNITTIGDDVFGDCKSLQSIILPESLTSLGRRAFYQCTSLGEVTIPISLNSVQFNEFPAFEQCTNITRIIFTVGTGIGFSYNDDDDVKGIRYYGYTPWQISNCKNFVFTEGITSIGTMMFYHHPTLTTVSLPDSLTAVGDKAFYQCVYLSSANLGSGLTTIGGSAFEKCENLTTISLPNSLTVIGQKAFLDCFRLQSVSVPEHVTIIEDEAFRYCRQMVSLTFAGDVTRIGNDSFGECQALETLVLPDSLTTLGRRSFYDCTVLTDLTIPISVNAVVSNQYPAFEKCESITKVTFTAGTGTGFSYDSDTSSTGTMCRTYTPWFISGCSTVEFAGGVISVGSQAFYECTSLSNITFSNTVRAIGNNAFYGCTGITALTISDSVTELGNNAFGFCNNMKHLTIPISLNASAPAGSDAYPFDITGLESITFTKGDGSAFDYVSDNSINNTPWKLSESSLDTITFSEGIVRIGNRFMWGNAALTELTIPDSVQSIGQSAFYGCNYLTEVSLPISTDIVSGNRDTPVFEGCNIATITFTAGNGVGHDYQRYTPGTTDENTIEKTPWFLNKASITEVSIPVGVTHIGDWMFADMEKISAIHLLCDDCSIGNGTFYGCIGLTDPNLVGCTSVGDSAFGQCTSITTLTIPGTVSSIGKEAFIGCTGIAALTLQNGVDTIGDDAFIGCMRLISITAPDSVTSIGSAFADLELESFYTGANLGGEYCIGFKNGKITVTEKGSALMKGGSYCVALRVNGEIPDAVRQAAGVFDVYTVEFGDGISSKDCIEVSVNIMTKSRVREVFQIAEDGTMTRLSSSNDYLEGGATAYRFSMDGAGYVSVMSEDRDMAQEKLAMGVLLVAGTLIGVTYIILAGRRS